MAKTKVLFISNCFGDNSKFHAKGTIEEFDDEKKSDVPILAALKAGGRIVPPVKENLVRVKDELLKKKESVPKQLDDELSALDKPVK